MSNAEALTALKAELLQALVSQVPGVPTRAVREGTAVHQVEADLWDLALKLGRRGLAASSRPAAAATCGRSAGGCATTSTCWRATRSPAG
jgi:hypothetical protein